MRNFVSLFSRALSFCTGNARGAIVIDVRMALILYNLNS